MHGYDFKLALGQGNSLQSWRWSPHQSTFLIWPVSLSWSYCSPGMRNICPKIFNGSWKWPPKIICSFVVLFFFLRLRPLYFGILQNTNEKILMSQAVNPSVICNFQSTWAELQLSQSLNAGTPLPDIFVIIGSSDNHRDMWNISSVSHFCAPMLTRASPALFTVPTVFSDIFPAKPKQFPRPGSSNQT